MKRGKLQTYPALNSKFKRRILVEWKSLHWWAICPYCIVRTRHASPIDAVHSLCRHMMETHPGEYPEYEWENEVPPLLKGMEYDAKVS